MDSETDFEGAVLLTGILGGGPSGVALQRFLDDDSEILEKEQRLGGLCRTFQKEGFSYDIGGHVIFSKNNEYMDFIRGVLAENCGTRRRVNQVLFKGRYVKYPFENDLAALGLLDNLECLAGYLFNHHPKPANFKEWMLANFGTGITKKYLAPYNEKIWKYPLDQMGLEWVGRVPKPPARDVLKSALGIKTEGYTHQLNFNYPKKGGFEAMVKTLAKEGARVVNGFKVQTVRWRGGAWMVSDGRSEKQFDRLVSTIALPYLIDCLEQVPSDVRRAVDELRYNPLRIVLVGVRHTGLKDRTAVYVPDPSVLAHRICFMTAFSEWMAPEGKSSVIAEISTPRDQELYHASDDYLTERVIADLEKLNILDRKDVVVTDVRRVEHGYVVYDLDYQTKMNRIRSYFNELGLELLGRFAEFEYINSDQAILKALQLAQKLNGRTTCFR